MQMKLADFVAGNYAKNMKLSANALNEIELLVIEEIKKDLPPGAFFISVAVDAYVTVQGTKEKIVSPPKPQKFIFETNIKVTESELLNKEFVKEQIKEASEHMCNAKDAAIQKILDPEKENK